MDYEKASWRELKSTPEAAALADITEEGLEDLKDPEGLVRACHKLILAGVPLTEAAEIIHAVWWNAAGNYGA